jgi:hypothetical protein
VYASSQDGENKLFEVRQTESVPHRTFGGEFNFKEGSVVVGTTVAPPATGEHS